jgi:signal transduction histidine kinase
MVNPRKVAMLHDFIKAHRDALIEACRRKVASRSAPRPTDAELETGVPLFLDQVAEALREALKDHAALEETARRHGEDLLNRGFTIAQVVHDYGGVCQAITSLAIQRSAPISTRDFQLLNGILDNAIAGAVSAYNAVREHKGTERMGQLAHELRNLLGTAVLAFDVLKGGGVGVEGTTSAILGRSLGGLRKLIDRELAQVRLEAGGCHLEPVRVCELVEEMEAASSIEASAHGLELAVQSVGRDVFVMADRQIMASVVSNLLQNALKFTRQGTEVSLRVETPANRVLIHVEDACGGLPRGKADELFNAFEQRSSNRSGLGLGLAISKKGAETIGGTLRVTDRPGRGCMFTLELPRAVGGSSRAQAV